jgi:hypothetical protein
LLRTRHTYLREHDTRDRARDRQTDESQPLQHSSSEWSDPITNEAMKNEDC